MDEAIEFLNAIEVGLGYGFTRSTHPGRILVVLDGDLSHLEAILAEADDVWQVSDEAVLAWITNADLESVPMDEDEDEYHAECRAEWVAHGRALEV